MKIIYSLKQQRGVSLLEVMISVLILSVGLLGVAGLQTSSMRHTNSTLERTMAVVLTDTLSELLRANPIAAKQGGYTITDCIGSANLGTAAWVSDVKQVTRADACPVVTWDGVLYTVTLVWGDERLNASNSIVTQVMP